MSIEKCNFVPYEGADPYIFISYAHADKRVVFPILERLNAEGFRIWYDEGIEWGSEWPDAIAEHIDNCHTCLCIISRNSVASKNCRNEINFAIDADKNILVVYLEDIELPKGMKLMLSAYQASFYYQYYNKNDFFSRFISIPGIKACLRGNNKSYKKPTSEPKRVEEKYSSENDYNNYPDFEIVDDVIIGYLGDASHVVIPSFIKGIESSVFSNIYSIERVECQKNSKLQTIGEYAFMGCENLTKIILPDSLERIGEACFFECDNLSLVEIGEGSRLNSIGRQAFWCCKSLTQITIPDGVKVIGEEAFYMCSRLTTVNISQSCQLKRIEKDVFYECNSLTQITIPDEVLSIGIGAFQDCNSLTSVNIGQYSLLKDIYDLAFAGCNRLTSINIPQGVNSIGDNAFGVTSISSVTVSRYCSLGVYAFPPRCKVNKI